MPRTYTNEEIDDIAKDAGVAPSTIRNRIRAGWEHKKLRDKKLSPREAAQRSPWSRFVDTKNRP